MATSSPLSMNVGDPVARAKSKPSAPKAEIPPAAPKEDLVSRYKSTMEEPERKVTEAIESEQKFKMAQEQDLATRTAAKARARGAALEAERTAVERAPQMQQLSEVERAMETPFVPTQENAMDLATLYSLIGVVGFAIGAGGKGNAMAAMSAMNGMAEGHRAGRMDLYAREKDQFDTNMKQLKTRADTLARGLERITKLAAYDRQKAELEADALFAEQGGNFIKEYAAKYGLPKSSELAKRNADSIQKAFEMMLKAETDAERRREQHLRQMELRALTASNRQPQYQLVEQEGKVVAINMRDPTAPPVETGLKPGSKKFGAQTRGGAANDRFAFNIHESALQATTDLLNITSQPANTVLGTFAAMTGKSGETLTTALRNTFARKITSDDQRLMQQMIAGLEYNMGRALGGGYANSSAKAVLDIYKQQVAQAGDSPAAQAMFLARMKQELKTLFKAFKNHPGAQTGYIEDLTEASTLLDEAIPFDVKDVTSAVRGTRQTFVDKYVPTIEGSTRLALPTAESQTFGAKSFATEAEAQAAFKAGTLKSGEKVIINGVRGTWE
jgi:hypothetical protein